jgi:exodeoxyribonuclease-3
MKIITWNVNGLRAIWKKGALQELIKNENPDIIGLQETKSEVEQLTDETKDAGGYFSFFESSTMRKGYSGVAIYSKTQPKEVKGILGNILKLSTEEFLDNEGRFIMAEYEKFYLLNCYWPNGGKSPEHFLYKLEYYKKFLELAKKLEKQKPVIFMGDINATVADIDLARPKENAGELGCTPEERAELAKYCENFLDTWRDANPLKQEYTWWDMKTRARERNVGWRIDYIFVSKTLKDKIKRIEILGSHLGSDHSPVVLEIDL